MTDKNDKWFETLTGRQGDDTKNDASCLRRALLKLSEFEKTEPKPEETERQLKRLISTLEQDGLLDEQAKHPAQPKAHPMRMRYAIAAMLAAAVVVPLTYFIYSPTEVVDIEIERGDLNTQSIVVTNPLELSVQLEKFFTKHGGQVERYEYNGDWIIDARFADNISEEVAEYLATYKVGITHPRRILILISTAGTP